MIYTLIHFIMCPCNISLQVTLPLGSHDKCPVSVSFIARHGGDRFLLDTVQEMYTSLQEQADIAAKSNLSSNSFSQEESAEIAKEKVGFLFTSSTVFLYPFTGLLCSLLDINHNNSKRELYQ